ncbi:uncharacterized protein LOC135374099 isoform X3 [Ornithodoros turicata]|uniref:uncharacterized protein LOC135374099 isoform X3 n=1 Tax=Ornithodoros turicata TaxID=34597 RepID=UPI00313A0AE5
MKVLLLLLVVIGLAAADALPWKGRRSADPVLELDLFGRSADPENSKFKAREASPGYLLEEFLKRRSADPVAAAYYVPARARRSADPGRCFLC